MAVILRRGPSKHVLQIRWSLRDDSFEVGHWLAGRVYADRSHLSPDGELLVYFAAKFGADPETFTAVARPPWFTALALWPHDGSYGGGGYFEHSRRLGVQARTPDAPSTPFGPVPSELDVVPMDMLAPPPSLGTNADVSNPIDPTYSLQHQAETRGDGSIVDRFRVVRAGVCVRELGVRDWAGWGPSGDLLHAADGVLLRTPGPRRETSCTFGADKILADFSGAKFELVASPPHARRWPAGSRS